MNKNHFFRVFIITILIFCFIADISVYSKINNVYAYYFMAFIIVLAMLKYIINKCIVRDTNKAKVIWFQFKYNFISKIVIYLYSLTLLFFGLTEKRFLSSNIQTFINGLSSISVFYLLGVNAFDYSVTAMLYAYIIEISVGLIRKGINISLEFHDLAFSVGYVILYMLYTGKYRTKKGFIILTVMVLVAVGAGKRIGLLAIIFTIFLWKIIDKAKDNRKRRMMFWGGCIIVAVNLLFLQFSMNTDIRKIAARFPIGMSGREYYYEALQPYVRNEITFLGLGRNAVQVIMTEDFPWFHVGNVHSDIFRMYAECGFILFFLWLLWYLIIMVRSAIKKFGTSVGEFVFLLTVYTFIVYFTDNTELYLMNQYFYILAMLTFSYEAKAGEYSGKCGCKMGLRKNKFNSRSQK